MCSRQRRQSCTVSIRVRCPGNMVWSSRTLSDNSALWSFTTPYRGGVDLAGPPQFQVPTSRRYHLSQVWISQVPTSKERTEHDTRCPPIPASHISPNDLSPGSHTLSQGLSGRHWQEFRRAPKEFVAAGTGPVLGPRSIRVSCSGAALEARHTGPALVWTESLRHSDALKSNEPWKGFGGR